MADTENTVDFGIYNGMVSSFLGLVDRGLPVELPQPAREFAATAAAYYVNDWMAPLVNPRGFGGDFQDNPETLTLRARNTTNEGILKGHPHADDIAKALDNASRYLPTTTEGLQTLAMAGGVLDDLSPRSPVPHVDPRATRVFSAEEARQFGGFRTGSAPLPPPREDDTAIILPERPRHRARNWAMGITAAVAAAAAFAAPVISYFRSTPVPPPSAVSTQPSTTVAPLAENHDPNLYINAEVNGTGSEKMVTGFQAANTYITGLGSASNLFIMSPNNLDSQDAIAFLGTLPTSSGNIRFQYGNGLSQDAIDQLSSISQSQFPNTTITIADASGDSRITVLNGNVLQNQLQAGSEISTFSNAIMIAGDTSSHQTFGRIITADSAGDAARQSQSYLATLSGADATNLFATFVGGPSSPQYVNNALQGAQGVLASNGSVYASADGADTYKPIDFQQATYGPNGALNGVSGTTSFSDGSTSVVTQDGKIVGGATNATDTAMTITVPTTTPAVANSGPSAAVSGRSA